MSAQLAGLSLVVLAIIALLVGVSVVFVRGAGMRRALGHLAASPSARAIAGIAENSRHIAESAAPLSTLGARIEAITDRLSEAALTGTQLGVELSAVARVVDDLLDTFVPSLRGSASAD